LYVYPIINSLWQRVVSTLAEGIAAQDSVSTKEKSFGKIVTPKGLNCIGGTAGAKAAGFW
jgi:hypothetical protein